MCEIFIILFFIILLFYCFNKILSSNEYFDNQNTDYRNIYFLNKNELSNILIKDEDNYYKLISKKKTKNMSAVPLLHV